MNSPIFFNTMSKFLRNTSGVWNIITSPLRFIWNKKQTVVTGITILTLIASINKKLDTNVVNKWTQIINTPAQVIEQEVINSINDNPSLTDTFQNSSLFNNDFNLNKTIKKEDVPFLKLYFEELFKDFDHENKQQFIEAGIKYTIKHKRNFKQCFRLLMIGESISATEFSLDSFGKLSAYAAELYGAGKTQGVLQINMDQKILKTLKMDNDKYSNLPIEKQYEILMSVLVEIINIDDKTLEQIHLEWNKEFDSTVTAGLQLNSLQILKEIAKLIFHHELPEKQKDFFIKKLRANLDLFPSSLKLETISDDGAFIKTLLDYFNGDKKIGDKTAEQIIMDGYSGPTTKKLIELTVIFSEKILNEPKGSYQTRNIIIYTSETRTIARGFLKFISSKKISDFTNGFANNVDHKQYVEMGMKYNNFFHSREQEIFKHLKKFHKIITEQKTADLKVLKSLKIIQKVKFSSWNKLKKNSVINSVVFENKNNSNDLFFDKINKEDFFNLLKIIIDDECLLGSFYYPDYFELDILKSEGNQFFSDKKSTFIELRNCFRPQLEEFRKFIKNSEYPFKEIRSSFLTQNTDYQNNKIISEFFELSNESLVNNLILKFNYLLVLSQKSLVTFKTNRLLSLKTHVTEEIRLIKEIISNLEKHESFKENVILYDEQLNSGPNVKILINDTKNLLVSPKINFNLPDQHDRNVKNNRIAAYHKKRLNVKNHK